jgi:Holliday junction resolvasome RuvABC endonuclease subunit
MIRIGIDPSINSTGICIKRGKKTLYYIITSKMTKKMKAFQSHCITYLPSEKQEAKNEAYSTKENVKFCNIYSICEHIYNILSELNGKEVEVYMEGVSYGSVGSAALVDLSFLNASIRMTLKRLNIPFTIVSPTSLKKFACANGQADKFLMIDAWKRMDKNISDIKDIKIDDLADSYFLACYKSEN